MGNNGLMVKCTALFLLIVLLAPFASVIKVNAPSDAGSGDVKPAGDDPPHVMINEFGNQPEAMEKVELYNPTGSSVSLAGWKIGDGEDNWTLSGTIDPGGHVVFTPALDISNTKDDLYLYNDADQCVDNVSFSWLGGCPDPEHSWTAARAPDGSDTNNDAVDWTLDPTPTMNSTHSWANDAPAPNLGGVDVIINEVLPYPSTGGEEYVELFNNGSSPVNITYWYITDGSDGYNITQATVLNPGEYWVLNESTWEAGAPYFDGLHLYYGDWTPDNVYLFTDEMVRVDQVGWSTNHGQGFSLVRYPDGMGKCYAYDDDTLVECGWAEGLTENGTPGEANDCTHINIIDFYVSPSYLYLLLSSESVVNATIKNQRTQVTHDVNVTLELPNNVDLEPPTQTQTVDLGDLDPYNVTSVTWNINVTQPGSFRLNLTVKAADTGSPRKRSVYLTAVAHYVLINEFIVQPTDSESVELYNPTGSEIDLSKWILGDGEANMTLSGTMDPSVGNYTVIDTNPPLMLADYGDDIYLYDNSTGIPFLVDTVAYGRNGGCPDPPESWSACRAPNGKDTDDDAMNWNVNASTGPTMGSANNAPPAALCEGPIVINEVLANPSGVPEFIELYNNATSGSVDIGGWWLSDGEGVYVIPSGSIAAGAFWFANTTDWVGTGLSLENERDNVYLFNSTGHRMDQMGWTSNHGDGTSLARFNDGMGECYAYDDDTLVLCGWGEGVTENGTPGDVNNCTHIGITSFYVTPSFLYMRISNDTEVHATIKNQRTQVTHDVNVTLELPNNVDLNPPSPTQSLKVPLGDLDPYEQTSVTWTINVSQPGSYRLNVTVEASDTGSPRKRWDYLTAVVSVDIVFDFSHDQYYDRYDYDIFIDLLEELGLVYYNSHTITEEMLESVKLLVIPDLGVNFTANEAGVIKDWIENKSGSLLIMGMHHNVIEPEKQNNVTLDFGIEFTDTQIMDNNDNTGNNYWPIIYNWADNAITNFLTYNVTKVTAGRGCALSLTGAAVPIGTGDTEPVPDGTYAEDPDGVPVFNGSDVIAYAAVDVPGGGRIFAAGSSQVFTDTYYMEEEAYDNKEFAWNIIVWLMMGNATFNLLDAWNVTLTADLALYEGANIEVMFYDYAGAYQARKTLWTGTPGHVTIPPTNISHPLGLPIEMITLVITNSTGGILLKVTGFVVHRSDLIGRLGELDYLWTVPGSDRSAIMKEYVAIDGQWPYAPP